MAALPVTYLAHLPAPSDPSIDRILDSSILKAICCLPILGNIPSFFALTYSWKKSSETQTRMDFLCGNSRVMQLEIDNPESIKHAKLCKEYLIISLFRNALHISLMAIGILSSSPLNIAVFIGASFLTGYYYENWNSRIQQFEALKGAEAPR